MWKFEDLVASVIAFFLILLFFASLILSWKGYEEKDKGSKEKREKWKIIYGVFFPIFIIYLIVISIFAGPDVYRIIIHMA